MTYRKMHSSRVLANLDFFRINNPDIIVTKLMRSHLDMFLIWQVIGYFRPRSFLEIGFAAGQTMGIIYESSDQNAEYVSVEKNYKYLSIFQTVFPDATIEYNEIDSQEINLKNRKFDFIHIDGDHSYDLVVNDIQKCLPIMDEKSILYMDDFAMPGVDRAIREKIIGETDLVPFLCGNQSVFFHHKSQTKDKFLDIDIQERSKNFIDYPNELLYDHMVLKPRMPNVFVDHVDIFIDVLKAYDL
jgi:predicted O-methyltransferase YrrM